MYVRIVTIKCPNQTAKKAIKLHRNLYHNQAQYQEINHKKKKKNKNII